MPPSPSCPLCAGTLASSFADAGGRLDFRCPECGLIFLEPGGRPGPDEERARYETHENDPSDPGYRTFLDRLARPMVERLEPGARGLDYGSGPGPTLSVMLAERGFPTAIYDPYFAPDGSVLERRYDFVTCTETVEHFFRPGWEFERLGGLVRPGGWLGIMTEWVPGMDGGEPDPEAFAEWYYRRDPTHVCFYGPATLRWIARHFGWEVELPRRSVALFRVSAREG